MDRPLPSIRARPGFTLIELMVVVVLIGIMTAMIVPQMKGTYENALLRATSRKIVNVFSLASSRAIALNQVHRVRLDRKNTHYLVERPVRDGEGTSGFVPAREVLGGDGELDRRISIEARAPGEAPSSAAPGALVFGNDPRKQDRDEVIAFYPDGTADAVEIVLRDRDGFGVSLRINPVTARVRVIELERE